MYACSFVCMHISSVDDREGVESPGDGISGGCEMRKVGARNQTGPMGLLTTEPSHWLHVTSRRNQRNSSPGVQFATASFGDRENLVKAPGSTQVDSSTVTMN